MIRANRPPRPSRWPAWPWRPPPAAIFTNLWRIATYRFGTQSWTYFPDWLGSFYPPRLTQPEALEFYAKVFDTVEVNATFHALPSDSTVRGWYNRTPPGFRFALKFPREITHDLRLALPEAEAPTRAFLRAADLLQEKGGPLLLQLPPSFQRSAENRLALARFLELLPGHQVAVELRHRAWIDPAVERALAERNVAWCLVDGDQENHRAVMFTADFGYIRWNRSGLRFEGFAEIQHDRSEALDWWADLLRQVPAHVQTVWGYMANEFAGHAPASLRMLADRLGLDSQEPRAHWPQSPLPLGEG
jgi:uncharacterized protein YecE (DUF72 family)